MASGTKRRAVRHHNPFTGFFHAIREKRVGGLGLTSKVTDFLDATTGAQRSPLAGASAFATPDATKSAILLGFAVHS